VCAACLVCVCVCVVSLLPAILLPVKEPLQSVLRMAVASAVFSVACRQQQHKCAGWLLANPGRGLARCCASVDTEMCPGAATSRFEALLGLHTQAAISHPRKTAQFACLLQTCAAGRLRPCLVCVEAVFCVLLLVF
jgi:hypothetical protein